MLTDGDGTFFILHIVCNLVYLGGVQTPGGEVSGREHIRVPPQEIVYTRVAILDTVTFFLGYR